VKRSTSQNAGALLVALTFAAPARASGPSLPTAVFIQTARPDSSLEDFTRGRLGVVLPTWTRSFLVVAYRQMEGGSFDADERRALTRFWADRMPHEYEPEATPPLQQAFDEWRTARSRVPGAITTEPPQPYVGWGYAAYVNCGEDAFRNATRTLAARIAKFGATSAEVTAWLAGQDSVFAACSGRDVTLAPAPESLAPLVQADRAYQQAAIAFYARHFDEAARRFDAIARTADSPWRGLAPYLAARALVRQGTLYKMPGVPEGQDDGRLDTLALKIAATRLERVLDDPAQSAMHAAARRLLAFVRIRVAPAERLLELERNLTVGHDGATLYQDLWDYAWLLDRGIGAEVSATGAAKSAADLTDWVLTFQRRDPAGAAHALERWRATRSTAWLVATLVTADAPMPALAEVIAASRGVPRTSPAWLTLARERTRLLAASSHAEDRATARRELEAILGEASLPPSARNLLLRQRLELATSLEDAIPFVPRRVASVAFLMDGSPLNDYAWSDLRLRDIRAGRLLFDDDGAALMNQRVSLDALAGLAFGVALPDSMRAELAKAAWARAVVLGRDSLVVAYAPRVAHLVPALAGAMAEVAASDRAALGFTATLTLLRHPGLRPYVDPSVGRGTPLAAIDPYRDNWWCSPGSSGDVYFEFHPRTPVGTMGKDSASLSDDASLLPPSTAARAERSLLPELSDGPTWLTRRVLTWANAHHSDPRVPEALALAVRSTRYGCDRPGQSALSKEGFQLLHARYPNSAWAKRTPYWY
jgi:hypothetical protein